MYCLWSEGTGSLLLAHHIIITIKSSDDDLYTFSFTFCISSSQFIFIENLSIFLFTLALVLPSADNERCIMVGRESSVRVFETQNLSRGNNFFSFI